jgi:hypothetical protein
MKFDTPATTNPIDQLKVIGQPLDRIDGKLKTTGTAPTPTSAMTLFLMRPTATSSVPRLPRAASRPSTSARPRPRPA